MKISLHAFRAMIATACLAGSAYAQQSAQLAYEPSSNQVSMDNLGSEVISTSFRNCDNCDPSYCDDGASSCCNLGASCDAIGCGCGCCSLEAIRHQELLRHSIWWLDASRLPHSTQCGWKPGNQRAFQKFQQLRSRSTPTTVVPCQRVANGCNGLDWGGRIDYLYGTDGQDTQAFGNANGVWDNNWNNGGFYGHALSQAYGELAYSDVRLKVGHFFGLGGAEYVPAINNFFYSRQFNFFNSRPLTMTGAVVETKLSDETTIWNGYGMGWDSGFQDNGDLYISGFNRKLDDCTTLTMVNNLGRFDQRRNERGQMHSLVLTRQLNCKMTSISQVDYLYTHNGATSVRNSFGLIQYFLYTLDRNWSVGSRTEWYNYSSGLNQVQNADIYNQTIGLNYRPNANLIFRPELRQIWDINGAGGPVGVNEGGKASQMVFGTDMILTY